MTIKLLCAARRILITKTYAQGDTMGENAAPARRKRRLLISDYYTLGPVALRIASRTTRGPRSIYATRKPTSSGLIYKPLAAPGPRRRSVARPCLR